MRKKRYYTEHYFIKESYAFNKDCTLKEIQKEALRNLSWLRSKDILDMRKRVDLNRGLSIPLLLNVIMMTEGMTLTEARNMSVEEKLSYVYLFLDS